MGRALQVLMILCLLAFLALTMATLAFHFASQLLFLLFSAWHDNPNSIEEGPIWRSTPTHDGTPNPLPPIRDLIASWVSPNSSSSLWQDIISHIKHPLDDHYNTSSSSEGHNKLYPSCAVVGNSGILLVRRYGPLIDSHHVVIRLNHARIAGFEPFVGTNTTLSFINSHVLKEHNSRPHCSPEQPYGLGIPVVFYICQVSHFLDVAMCNKHWRNYNANTPLLLTSRAFDNLCARIAKHYSLTHFVKTTGKPPSQWAIRHDGLFFHYSSGLQALVLALGMCRKVSMFGFGKSPQAKHHYHTYQKKEVDLHDYEAEGMFYNHLAHNKTDFIPFFKDAGFPIPLPHVQIFL